MMGLYTKSLGSIEMDKDKSPLARHSIGNHEGGFDSWLQQWDTEMGKPILNASVLAFLLSTGWEHHPPSTPRGDTMRHRRLLIYLSILAGSSAMPVSENIGGIYWSNRRLIEQAARKAVCEHVFGGISGAIRTIKEERQSMLVRRFVHYGLGVKWRSSFLDRGVLDLLFDIFDPKGTLFPSWKGRKKWEGETAETRDAGIFFRWILASIWGDRHGDRELLAWARRRTYRWIVAFYPAPLKYADRRSPWVQKVLRRDFRKARMHTLMARLRVYKRGK